MTLPRLLAGALAVLGALVGWQVLRPAELLDPATDAYPMAVSGAPGVTGKTVAAPLIVDGRIRVFAAKRQVRADAPVDAKTLYTPRWSYRRWPQQLNGVVAVGSMVITRWSDGKLVAIDGRTGRIAWRADGPSAGGYVGERTGATTVWAPPGLHTVGSSVLAGDRAQVVAFDAVSGRRQWAAAGGDCFTTVGGQVACGARALSATGWPVGPFTPLGCGVAASGCVGLRDAAGQGWLTDGPVPRRAPALDAPGSTVAGAIRSDDSNDPGPVILDVSSGTAGAAGAAGTAGTVVARSPADGAELWRWSATPSRTVRRSDSSGSAERRSDPSGSAVIVLGADAGSGSVHLLTADRELITLDAGTGAVRSAFVLTFGTEKTTWTPGRWQDAGGYLAIERLAGPASPSVVIAAA